MSKKTKEIISALIKAGIALAIFVVAIVNYDKLENIDVRGLVENSANIYFAVGTILGVYLIKSVLFVIPASLIYISVGMAFSPATAIIINLCGIAIEVIVTYFLGKFLGGDYVNKLLSKSKGGKKILEKEFNNNFWALCGIRFLPVFPIDFVSLFWGASKCNFLKYFFASMIGIAPRVILFTVLGDGIYDYIPINLLMKIVICLIPVGVVAYLIYYFVKHKKVAETAIENKEENQKES